MSAIVYLNGEYLPRDEAKISVEDRGFLLADGVYEVVRVYDGRPFELDRHIARFTDSLAAIRLDVDAAPLGEVTRELVQRNALPNARVYWQATRGPAQRKHAFPQASRPTVLALIDPEPQVSVEDPLPEASAILHPDLRWANNGIKSIMLLPGALARQAAAEAGCTEAFLHREGVITEGAATTAWAMIDGELRTHPLDGSILPGVTRIVVLELAETLGIPSREEAFTTDELARASEVFITGTTSQICAITCVDKYTYPAGPVTKQLQRAFLKRVLRDE